MKICPNHWQELRAALDDRGIGTIGAKSGEEAHENVMTELEGGQAPYDPLMSCNMMIWSNGLRAGGLYLMGQKEDGSAYCPICEAVAHGHGDDAYWINSPADAALEECRKRGLAPERQ
jgi:hypothetical protein